MKILLLADIHANWPALQAIDESFDLCLFLGDVVDYATQPLECIEWLRRHADFCIRGNHDHAVAQNVPLTPGGMFRQIAAAMRDLHREVLSDEHLTWLAQLPVTRHLNIDGYSFYLVHATPRDPLDEYIPGGRSAQMESPDPELASQWAQRLEHIHADFVCVGHSHVPMDVQLENCRVVNPGSVGQPRDGDPRAAYAVIEDGDVRFCRVEYDISQTVEHMAKVGVDPDIIEKVEAVLRNGGNPRPWAG